MPRCRRRLRCATLPPVLRNCPFQTSAYWNIPNLYPQANSSPPCPLRVPGLRDWYSIGTGSKDFQGPSCFLTCGLCDYIPAMSMNHHLPLRRKHRASVLVLRGLRLLPLRLLRCRRHLPSLSNTLLRFTCIIQARARSHLSPPITTFPSPIYECYD